MKPKACLVHLSISHSGQQMAQGMPWPLSRMTQTQDTAIQAGPQTVLGGQDITSSLPLPSWGNLVKSMAGLFFSHTASTTSLPHHQSCW